MYVCSMHVCLILYFVCAGICRESEQYAQPHCVSGHDLLRRHLHFPGAARGGEQARLVAIDCMHVCMYVCLNIHYYFFET